MKSNGTTVPTRAVGTTTKLTIGMANAFASGDTSEICWNMPSSGGISAAVTAICVLIKATSQ